MSGRIVQINISPGGVPKTRVATARVGVLGLEGDAHRDRENHGGPERAVCLYAMEVIRALQTEGHPIVPGAIGENVTVEGLDWSGVVPGCHMLLGDRVVLQVTRYASPCSNITAAFRDGNYARVAQKRNPGWSRVCARVVTPGSIRQGDHVRLLTASESAEVLAGARP